MKTRKGRARPRPLAVRHTMHLVLRSSKAKGPWSFKSPKNSKAIYAILNKFTQKNQVRVLSLANVGNHLHLHIQLGKRDLYKPFIRAITSAIATAVAGKGWRDQYVCAENSPTGAGVTSGKGWRDTHAVKARAGQALKFWDYRPFTRIVFGVIARLRLSDYIKINQIEAYGASREQARWLLNRSRSFDIVKGFG